MAPLRPFSLYQTRDQWLRAAHRGTAIDAETGGVQLAFAPPRPVDGPGLRASLAGGLAFDSGCRLYHSLPDSGCVERVLWAAQAPLARIADQPEPLDLFETARPNAGSGFVPSGPAHGPLRQPGALAIDAEDRLIIAETGARRVVVADLQSRHVIRRVSLGAAGRGPLSPIDLATDGRTIWVLTRPFGILRMTPRSGPLDVTILDPEAKIPRDLEPRRLAISPTGEFALLGGTAEGAVVFSLVHKEFVDADGRPRRGLSVAAARLVPDASDVEYLEPRLLVVALGPGEDLLRVRDGVPDAPFKAKGYDGAGIVRTPDGRIAFSTDLGVRHAVDGRIHYVSRGRVSTYALDGRDFQQTWGRLFLDACIPHGTELRVQFSTSDELPEEEPVLAHTPAAGMEDAEIRAPERTPPLVPISLEPRAGDRGSPVHRRTDGRELPWVRRLPDDPFQTFDVPVHAGPGRYLWIHLELIGDGRSTPRVRCLRAERPGHDLMRMLPRIYSREAAAESFLRRYLAIADGLLTGLADRSADRRALVDPDSTPEELLPWLAGFVGLVLDERWPVGRRRALIAEAVALFRLRGTIPGLLRFLELCLGSRPILIEQFRVRGLGGAVLREAGGPVASSPILGDGFRIGGAVGDLAEPATTTLDAFATNAHRFSLILPIDLSADQLAATTDLLDVHRPAHTIVELCPIRSGMRVGSGLHVGLSSVIGRSSGWDQLQLGGSTLGTTGLLGRAEAGIAPGAASLGVDSSVG